MRDSIREKLNSWGLTAVEYALLLALVVVAVASIFMAFKNPPEPESSRAKSVQEQVQE